MDTANAEDLTTRDPEAAQSEAEARGSAVTQAKHGLAKESPKVRQRGSLSEGQGPRAKASLVEGIERRRGNHQQACIQRAASCSAAHIAHSQSQTQQP